MAELKDMVGKTMTDVEKVDDDELIFTTTEGKKYKLYHSQRCCESVTIEDVVGDLADLIGHPLLMSEVVSYNCEEDLPPVEQVRLQLERTEDAYRCSESCTWTFYKFATVKGYVDVRWLGKSNGYYSERVDFVDITDW